MAIRRLILVHLQWSEDRPPLGQREDRVEDHNGFSVLMEVVEQGQVYRFPPPVRERATETRDMDMTKVSAQRMTVQQGTVADEESLPQRMLWMRQQAHQESSSLRIDSI